MIHNIHGEKLHVDGWTGESFPGKRFRIPCSATQPGGAIYSGWKGSYSCPSTAYAALLASEEAQAWTPEKQQEMIDTFQASIRYAEGADVPNPEAPITIKAAPSFHQLATFGGTQTLAQFKAVYDGDKQVQMYTQELPVYATDLVPSGAAAAPSYTWFKAEVEPMDMDAIPADIKSVEVTEKWDPFKVGRNIKSTVKLFKNLIGDKGSITVHASRRCPCSALGIVYSKEEGKKPVFLEDLFKMRKKGKLDPKLGMFVLAKKQLKFRVRKPVKKASTLPKVPKAPKEPKVAKAPKAPKEAKVPKPPKAKESKLTPEELLKQEQQVFEKMIEEQAEAMFEDDEEVAIPTKPIAVKVIKVPGGKTPAAKPKVPKAPAGVKKTTSKKAVPIFKVDEKQKKQAAPKRGKKVIMADGEELTI